VAALLDSAGQTAYLALLDQYQTRVGSANELIGAGNLEALQRYQTAVAQNPLVGLGAPGKPSLAALLPTTPDLATDMAMLLQADAPYLPRPTAGVPVPGRRANAIAQGSLMGHDLPKRGRGKARHRSAAIHNHFYVDGKEIAGLTKTEMRRAARKGNRRLPSGGG